MFSINKLPDIMKNCKNAKAAAAAAVILIGCAAVSQLPLPSAQASPDAVPEISSSVPAVPLPAESHSGKALRINAPKSGILEELLELEESKQEPEETGGFAGQEALDEMIAEVLETIITDDMTKPEQAYAVYRFTNKRVRYIGDSTKNSWQEGAYEGLRTGKGDCYTYYALSRALLTALDIDNLEVTRSEGSSSHFWNLVNCGDGWYHFDASPHVIQMPYGSSFFMFTDEEAAAYTRLAGRDYFTFDPSLYPERAAEPAVYSPLRYAAVPQKKQQETAPQPPVQEETVPEPEELPVEEPVVQEPEEPPVETSEAGIQAEPVETLAEADENPVEEPETEPEENASPEAEPEEETLPEAVPDSGSAEEAAPVIEDAEPEAAAETADAETD